MTATLEKEIPPLNMRKFEPPVAQIGQMVNWWPFSEVEGKVPVPAIVTEVGTRTLNVTLIGPNTQRLTPKDGVRHISDPDAHRPEFSEIGAWTHTDSTKRLLALEAKFVAMEVAAESKKVPAKGS